MPCWGIPKYDFHMHAHSTILHSYYTYWIKKKKYNQNIDLQYTNCCLAIYRAISRKYLLYLTVFIPKTNVFSFIIHMNIYMLMFKHMYVYPTTPKYAAHVIWYWVWYKLYPSNTPHSSFFVPSEAASNGARPKLPGRFERALALGMSLGKCWEEMGRWLLW